MLLDFLHHLGRFHPLLVRLGGHLRRALEIDVGGFQQALGDIEFGHGLKRYLVSFRGADEHIGQAAGHFAIRPGVAHHHLDFVDTALHPLRLGAVKRVPHLHAERVAGQAQRLRFRQDIEVKLIGGVAGAVADVIQAGVVAQGLLQLIRSGFQGVEIVVHEVEGDGGAPAFAFVVAADRKYLGAVNGSDLLAPALFDLPGGDVAPVLLGELNGNAAVDLLETVGGDVLHQFFLAAGVALVVRLHLKQGVGHLCERLLGALLRRAVGEPQFGLEKLAARLGRQDSAHLAAGKQPAAQDQQRHEKGEAAVAVLNAKAHQGAVTVFNKLPQPLIAALLQPVDRL